MRDEVSGENGGLGVSPNSYPSPKNGAPEEVD
jgi:hypothetical protein